MTWRVRLIAAVTVVLVAGGCGREQSLKTLYAGAPDEQFADKGRLTLVGPSLGAHSIAAAKDQGFYIFGGTSRTSMVWRHDGSGRPDTGFNDRARAALAELDPERPAGRAVLDDGSIALSGTSGSGRDYSFSRLLPDGRLDRSFGPGGFVRLRAATGQTGEITDISILPGNAGAMLVGFEISESDYWNRELRVVSFKTDGSLDPRYGHAGIVSTGLQRTTLIKDRAGRLVISGKLRRPQEDLPTAWRIIRLTSRGQPDSHFGSVAGVAPPRDGVHVLATQSDGKLLASFSQSPIDCPMCNENFLIRFSADGTIDGSFGEDGQVLAAYDALDEVVVDDRDRIIVVGYERHFVGFLNRLLPNGADDPGFAPRGNNKAVYLDLGDVDLVVTDALIDSAGQILVLAEDAYETRDRVFVLRYLSG